MDRPRRALVIEDEQDILDLLTRHLRRLGFLVSGAGTGERGFELAVRNPPDLVVVDILLPGMDGREVIRRLRGNRRTGRCAVVVCSILDPADLDDIDADGVLPKPFGKSAIAQVVTNATSQGAP